MANPTEAAAFRFDKIMLDKLRLDAEEKQINLSTLLDQIIESHIKWHANAAKAGFIPMRKTAITRLFDSLTKEQIDALAADASRDLTEETFMIMSSKQTEESILELLERWMRFSGFECRHEIDDDDDDDENNTHIFVIQHNMGEKWSHYLSRVFEHVASEFMNAKPDIQITENILFMRIRKGRS